MKYKKQILTLHKILGLTTGIVVFIVAITGCFWAFKEEIEALLNDDTVIEVRAQEHLTPTEAKDIAKTVCCGNTVL
ncbi:PepSY domain-containing protein, partial [Pseudoalteromonas sp. CR1]|nr:PepSY domain-containing protein [Pseudoalteromonas sp. CR1]